MSGLSAAEEYDRAYAKKDYKAESALLREIILDLNPDTRSLLDVGCGTGGHLAYLQRHFNCHGVDVDELMIAHARARLPEVTLTVADMVKLNLGRQFDVVISLFSVVGHLQSTEKLEPAISRMADHLAPGGVIAIEPWVDPEAWAKGGESAESAERQTRLAQIAEADPAERGRIALESRFGTRADVTISRGGQRMSWFTGAEYRRAFELAGLQVKLLQPGLTGRGLYIGRAGR